MSDTLVKLLKLRAPAPHMEKQASMMPVSSCPSLLVGNELEIEGVQVAEDIVVDGMTHVEDGSLRNNGREFITRPMTIQTLNVVLTKFFARAGLNSEENYSDRCSVHVHANCQDLTVDQLRMVLFLYQLFERMFFNFAGNEREHNIFCVPWSQTQLSYGIANSLVRNGPAAVHAWQKYTALNLLPLFTQGTIEFRHMPGTCDKDRIIIWNNLIGCLFEYAKTHPVDDCLKWVLTLNTTSEYQTVLDQVFREWGDHLRTPGFETLIEEGVLNAKYMMLDTLKEKQTSPQTANRTGDWIRFVDNTGPAIQPMPRVLDDLAQVGRHAQVPPAPDQLENHQIPQRTRVPILAVNREETIFVESLRDMAVGDPRRNLQIGDTCAYNNVVFEVVAIMTRQEFTTRLRAGRVECGVYFNVNSVGVLRRVV